ncbi:hypothetical protein ACXYMU_11175 [Pontibacter sp. CAU 1760]
MRQLSRVILLLCLPLLFFSCEDGLLETQTSKCLETSQWDDQGWRIERTYDGRKITKLEYFYNDELQYYYEYTYGSGSRIVQSQYYNAKNNTVGTPEVITYNDKGKWAKSTFTSTNGRVTTQSVEYDDQDRIQKITSVTDNSGTITNNFTITYTWAGGNNTGYTYTTATSETVAKYEFNLDQENKRRKEQEKTSFMSLAIPYNQNMLKRSEATTTTGATTTKRVIEYNYELDEKGYPYRLTRTISGTSYASPITDVTEFEFDCN